MELSGKHVLVTGGSAGIGLALAQALLRAGARVTLCGRSAARLHHAGEVLGPSARTICCDVADPGQHATLLDEAERAHGPLDLLINNAGVQQLMDFTDDAQPRQIVSEVMINLTAPLLLTEAVLPRLRRRPEAAIVQVTSGLALSPKASAPVYCAAKSGLRTFTRALRWQLEGEPLRVVEVLPPLVDTAMTAGRGRGKITAEQAAAEIIAGLRADREEIYVGRSRLLRWIVALSAGLAARITRRW